MSMVSIMLEEIIKKKQMITCKEEFSERKYGSEERDHIYHIFKTSMIKNKGTDLDERDGRVDCVFLRQSEGTQHCPTKVGKITGFSVSHKSRSLQ